PANANEWSKTVADYNAKGQLTAYAPVYDDGRRAAWVFDVDNHQPYERVMEQYDAQNRLLQQSVAFDDGLARELYFDPSDTYPWFSYVETYRLGSLVSKTYYNADGSVFS